MDPATAMDNNPPQIMHACTSTLDRISSLPDSIIENILSDLPLREAVKTSILSSAWRNKWRYIPEIVFDNEFCQLHSNKEKVNTDKLVWLDIFKILLLHRGTLKGLKFWIDKLETCPEVDQLFLFLCGKTIQEFKFRFGRYRSNYHLSSHLFSYDNLRKLTLSRCVFKAPPAFRGFHRLAHLAFNRVRFECEDFHQSFISHCPLLEHLTMFRCSGIDSFVIGFPNLKFLRLDFCSFTSFRFKRSPLLATVEILQDIYCKLESSNCLISFFDCLPALESIRVSYYFLMYLTTAESQKRLPTDIQSLQTLELHCISFSKVKEVSGVMCLVMSSPNLKNLKIKVCYQDDSEESDSEETESDEPDSDEPESDESDSDEPESDESDSDEPDSEESESEESDSDEPESEELFKYEEVSDYSSEQLRRVEMYEFSGSVPELEFVKFLLSKLTLLEVFVLKCRAGPIKQLVMLKDLVQLPRVSPKAKIICLDPGESED